MSSFMDYMYEQNKINENKVYGVVIGVVTNNKDPENLGRVKLKLPVRFGEKETDWVRIVVPIAGNNRGMFILPEVGDEVMVIFNEGDISEPFVIGGLWNSEEKPPEINEDGKNNLKKFKSRDSHEISIYDKENEGYIELKTKNGNSIKIYDEKNGKIQLKNKDASTEITLQGDSKSIDIISNSKVNIKSSNSIITVDGNQNIIDIKSDLKISLSSTNIEIKAKGNLNLNSDGMINIKGTMVKIN